MAGPLTQLGNVFYEGSRDWARVKLSQAEEQRRRNQQLEDEARHRQQQLEDRSDARTYEAEIFERNRQAAIVDTLIRSGLLAPGDAEDPTAIDAALKRLDPERARIIEEMAGYKTAIPEILKAIGNTSNVQSILQMGPENVADARKIMQDAYTALAARVEDDRQRGLTNAKNGAAMIATSMAQLSAIQQQVNDANNNIERLQSGQYTDEEYNMARQRAIKERPDLTGNLNQAKLTELNAVISKHAGDIAAEQIFAINQRVRNLAKNEENVQRQMDTIGQLSRAGALAFLPVSDASSALDPEPTTQPPPLESDAESDANSLGDFANELSATPGVMKTNPNQGAASDAGGNVFTPGEYVRQMRAEADARDANILTAEKTRMEKEAYDKAVDFEFSQLPEAEQKRIDPDRVKRLRSEQSKKERNRYNYENPFTGGPF